MIRAGLLLGVSKVGYCRETGENMLSWRFTAHDPQRTSFDAGCRRPATPAD
jgi:hypothetical protein